MKMKFNWRTMSLASALFVFALVSCELQVPSSVRIKSKPGLYLSLGNPFEADKMSLSKYLSEDELKKQLGGESGEGGDIDIRDWDKSPSGPGKADLLTYLVRYPVADININLSEYVESMDVASNLEGVSGGWILGTGSEIKIPLPLDSMSFAHGVTKVKIGVTLTFSTSTTPPAAGSVGENTVPEDVTVTFKSEKFPSSSPSTPTGNKWSSPEIATFEPATDKVSIGVTVPAGTWFSPQLSFDWEEATISLGAEEKQEGNYELDFTSFGSFMGEGISFKEVTGYMYLKKPDGGQLTADADVSLTWKKPNDGDATVDVNMVEEVVNWKDFELPPDADKKIDLTDLFKYKLKFSYELTLKKVTVKNNGNNNGRISVDMVILLPLEFTLENDSKNFSGYKKLNIDTLKGISESEGGDLLGRTDPEEDIFKGLGPVSILFVSTTPIFEGLYLGIKSEGTDEKPVHLGETMGKITIDSVPNPFNPKFELLVPNNKTLRILKAAGEKDAEIDFTIAVQAKTDLDYQVKF